VISSTQIQATAPAGTAGIVDVTVTTPYGTSTVSAADQFTNVAVPTVSSMGPASGTTAGGTSLTINGTNFTGLVSVLFGGVPATAITVTSSTQLSATSPAHAPGAVDVTVTTANGVSATSSVDQFTFVAPVPTVNLPNPMFGSTAGGNSVSISGQNFTGASQVFFGSVAAPSFTVNSDSSITATAPAESAGTVDIVVEGPYGDRSPIVTVHSPPQRSWRKQCYS
jgi:hypothetical protein